MAFLATTTAVSHRAPAYLASTSRRRPVPPAVVRATAAGSSSDHPNAASSPHPILSSLRLAASAAVLLAATSPALACAPSPALAAPPPAAAADTVPADDDPAPADGSQSFEKLIVETAALARFGGVDAARSRLSAASSGSSAGYARLLAAHALFVEGKVYEAIAAFEELAREDPVDYRPLFCQSVIYTLLGREADSQSLLERCRKIVGSEFSPDLTSLVSPADAVPDSESGQQKTEAGDAEAAKV